MLLSKALSFAQTSPTLAASSGATGKPKAAPPSIDQNDWTFHVSWSSWSITGDGSLKVSSSSLTWRRKSSLPCFLHLCSTLTKTSQASFQPTMNVMQTLPCSSNINWGTCKIGLKKIIVVYRIQSSENRMIWSVISTITKVNITNETHNPPLNS